MKKIEAVIRHYKLEDAKHTAAGVDGMTVTEVLPDQRSVIKRCTGSRIHGRFPKVKLEVVVPDKTVRAQSYDHPCRAHGTDRRRKDLRHRPFGSHPHSHRRNR